MEGKAGIELGTLPLCLRACFPKHLSPMYGPTPSRGAVLARRQAILL